MLQNRTHSMATGLTALIDGNVLSTYAMPKGVTMPIIITIVLLSILRYFEIGPFANMSWWWVAGLTGFAFGWFEFIEPILGLD